MANSLIKNNIFGLFIFIIAILLIILGVYAEWLWFESLNYLSVFKTVLFSKITLGAAVFISFFIFLLLNFMILKRRADIVHQKIYLVIIFIVSLFAGLLSTTYWFTVLRFLNYVNFGFVDPIFRNDIDFRF